MNSGTAPYGHSWRLTLVDRYILSRANRPFATALGVTLSALLLERLLRLFNMLAETHGSLGIVLELATNLVPHYLGLALPAGFFIAVFIAVAQLGEDNELDAMMTSGLSIYRLSRPFIIVGCAFALFSIVLFGFLQPYSRYAYRAILHNATNAAWSGQVRPRIFVDVDKKFVLSADSVDVTGTKLKGIFLRRSTRTGVQITTAQSGALALLPDQSEIGLLLENGVQLDDDAEGKPNLVKFTRATGKVSFNPNAPPFRARGDGERELTLFELYSAIMHPGSTVIAQNRLVSEFNARIIRALSLPFLPLLAIPLAMTAKRQRRSSGLLIAMLILFAYHHALQAGESLGDTGKLPAEKALWSIFGVFIVFCVWLFASSCRRPGDNPFSRLVERVARLHAALGRLRPSHLMRRAR